MDHTGSFRHLDMINEQPGKVKKKIIGGVDFLLTSIVTSIAPFAENCWLMFALWIFEMERSGMEEIQSVACLLGGTYVESIVRMFSFHKSNGVLYPKRLRGRVLM